MTGTLTELALAAAVFVASHVLVSGTRLVARDFCVWRLIAGVTLFPLLILAHGPVIGVSPLGL